MPIRKVLGANVRLFREHRGWSQEELATATGLHRTYISGVERGVRNPTIRVVARIAEALRVGPDDLLHKKADRRR